MADNTRPPPNTNFALPRNTTDFGYEVGRLVTYLRLGWAEDALREITLIEDSYQSDVSLHWFLVDDGLPSAFDVTMLNHDMGVLATLPPLIRSGQFSEALIIIERESTVRNLDDVKAAYDAAIAESHPQESTP